jgi:hypothetical protein
MTFDLAKYVRTRDPIDGSTAGGGDSGGPPVVDGEPNCELHRPRRLPPRPRKPALLTTEHRT